MFMNERKRNIAFMKYLLTRHFKKRNESKFTEEQIALIQELTALGYLNSSAFDIMGSGGKIWDCAMSDEYPLTAKGKEYIEMGWYKSLQQSGKYQLIRDIAAFIGAAAGVVIGILKIIYG